MSKKQQLKELEKELSVLQLDMISNCNTDLIIKANDLEHRIYVLNYQLGFNRIYIKEIDNV